MTEYVILVAGGNGSRMQSDIPKQFLKLKGKPVIMHTIEAFRSYSGSMEIILVLPETQFGYWSELARAYDFEGGERLVAGGETRFHSVRNGLASIDGDKGVVAVHDGVRPLISGSIIGNGFETARKWGSAVASVKLKDSIREVKNEKGENLAVHRENFRLVQTPQVFKVKEMKKAFTVDFRDEFTDCASVMEAAGHAIHLIEGGYENIKITTPEDLVWAEAIMG